MGSKVLIGIEPHGDTHAQRHNRVHVPRGVHGSGARRPASRRPRLAASARSVYKHMVTARQSQFSGDSQRWSPPACKKSVTSSVSHAGMYASREWRRVNVCEALVPRISSAQLVHSYIKVLPLQCEPTALPTQWRCYERVSAQLWSADF